LTLLVLGILAFAACRSGPFREPALAPVAAVDAERVRREFALALPGAFRIVNSVTFEFKGRAMAAIGYTAIDSSERTFKVVGLHPAAGVTLFEVSGDSGNAETVFAHREFTVYGDLGGVVGEDTRRIYFDRVPSPGASVSKERDRLLFRQDEGEGKELEYVFAGRDSLLLEKRFYENGGRIWTASYHEYRRERGKLYPERIVLEHHEYRYRLVLRLREIRS
jgi:hypothetical protein